MEDAGVEGLVCTVCMTSDDVLEKSSQYKTSRKSRKDSLRNPSRLTGMWLYVARLDAVRCFFTRVKDQSLRGNGEMNCIQVRSELAI